MKFLVNLYDVAECQFFGRTYESSIIPVIFQPDGRTTQLESFSVYFHLRPTHTEVHAVVEVMMFEKDSHDVLLDRRILGWGTVNLMEGPYKVNLKKGSCRVLNSKYRQPTDSTIYVVHLEISDCRWF
jgi:hypothetical protein